MYFSRRTEGASSPDWSIPLWDGSCRWKEKRDVWKLQLTPTWCFFIRCLKDRLLVSLKGLLHVCSCSRRLLQEKCSYFWPVFPKHWRIPDKIRMIHHVIPDESQPSTQIVAGKSKHVSNQCCNCCLSSKQAFSKKNVFLKMTINQRY